MVERHLQLHLWATSGSTHSHLGPSLNIHVEVSQQDESGSSSGVRTSVCAHLCVHVQSASFTQNHECV